MLGLESADVLVEPRTAPGNFRGQFAGAPAIVLRVTDTGEPGFDLLVDADAAAALMDALRAGGAEEIDAGDRRCAPRGSGRAEVSS